MRTTKEAHIVSRMSMQKEDNDQRHGASTTYRQGIQITITTPASSHSLPEGKYCRATRGGILKWSYRIIRLHARINDAQ
eukprot:scaffold673283_cov59-Prasinocladus_malaysianus.AAC.1